MYCTTLSLFLCLHNEQLVCERSVSEELIKLRGGVINLWHVFTGLCQKSKPLVQFWNAFLLAFDKKWPNHSRVS